jgi:hypothetical protein
MTYQIPPHEVWNTLSPHLAEVSSLYEAALEKGAPNVFAWQGVEVWVDRRRAFALGASLARELGAGESYSGDYEKIRPYGCRETGTRPREFVTYIASILAGRGLERLGAGAAALFVNFAVAQPKVNPAFASLLWLGLETEVRPASEPSMRLADRIGPMAYDLAKLPGDRESALGIRTAQVEFILDEFDPRASGGNFDRDRWLAASDAEWAEYCAEVRRAEVEHLEIELVDKAARL